MEVTRRYWEAVGTAVALAALAVLLDEAVLLWGTAAVGGWVLARQYVFRRAAAASIDSASTSLSLDRSRVRTGVPVAVTLLADLGRPAGDPITVCAPAPVGATGDAAETTIRRGEREGSVTTELTFPFAGRFSLPRPVVTVEDVGGLFCEVAVVDAAAAVLVDPWRPRNVHLGQGGEAVSATYGDHRTGRSGAGTVPAGVRRYVPGDDVRRIDWAATARLDEVYVREFEAETDRTTALVVDAGPSMRTGPPGETKLDYAVHVALTLLEVAADVGDPVGLFTVDGSDRLRWDPPAASPGHYATVRDALYDLEPSRASVGGSSAAWSSRGPTSTQRRALLAHDSPFADRLRPLLGRGGERSAHVAGDPLIEVARVGIRRIGGTVWTALVTDDSDRGRVLEAVRAARRGNDRVVVFLLPDVLFGPGGLGDVEAAYGRYREAEAFRRELDRLERVSAFEVGPTDRVEAILSARRRGGVSRA